MPSDFKAYNPQLPAKELSYNSIDPLDGRYYDAEIARFLSENARVGYQAHVEAVLAHTLAEFDLCSSAIAAEIKQAAGKVTAEQVYVEEQATKHDIKALVNTIKNRVSTEAKPFVHMAATSYDIVSTASSLQYRDYVQQVLIPRLTQLLQTLIKLVERYADTPQIGRTHGQHALPITFGFALAEYVSRIGESLEALKDLSQNLAGKFSGAVGAYNAQSLFIKDPLAFESGLLTKLGLRPAGSSTQIVPPEPLVRLLEESANVSGAMANLATDMRQLQRTEIAEVREKFEPRQSGSSTMAHKRNPINFENMVSFNKQVVAQLHNALLNLQSEHQRDLTDSASSRFYPVLFAIVGIMARRLNKAMAKLEVDADNMARNLASSAGLIGAEPLYLILGQLGFQNAHEKAKTLAHLAITQETTLAEVLKADAEAKTYWTRMSAKQQNIIIEPQKYYLGLASEKARNLTKRWQGKM